MKNEVMTSQQKKIAFIEICFLKSTVRRKVNKKCRIQFLPISKIEGAAMHQTIKFIITPLISEVGKNRKRTFFIVFFICYQFHEKNLNKEIFFLI